MTRTICVGSILIGLGVLAAGVSPARIAAQRPELHGLASLYDVAAGAVRDTNGDGLADAVAARVVVPAEPTIEDVQGAANIAGRLGFETTALTLPIVVGDLAAGASSVMMGRLFAATVVSVAHKRRRPKS